MKLFSKTEERASALIITLLVVFLIAASIGIAMHVTTTTVRQTDSSRDFSALRSAAEGALDFGYGIWAKTINSYYAPVSNSKLTANMGSVPSFNGFSYATSADGPLQITGTDEYGKPYGPPTETTTPSATKVNLDNYPGWLGFNTSYLASVRLTGTFAGSRTVSYGAKRSINYSVVPLFQATAFFEDNLELYKTAPMTITGLVHTNSQAYVSQPSPGVLTFGDAAHPTHLSYVGGYTDDTAPPQADTWSGYSPNSAQTPDYFNGLDQEVKQVNRMEPLGSDSASLLHPPIANGTSTGDTNPNDDSIRELIEPPNTYVDPKTQKIVTTSADTDPQLIADRRLYTKAGIRIRVSGATYTVSTANGTSLTSAQVTALKSALTQQTIYDRREAKNVDITTLDISKAKATLNAAAGFNGILYIDDTSSTGYVDPKGIRLTNGSILPSAGLTVASENSVYIQGDYNTGNNHVSSALFADAVTILSNGWKDSNSNAALSSRKASDTIVNTAIVAGFIPSGWTNPATGAQYGYSGGLNNFPRFLEDWSSKTFTYTGSMIELFTSQIATGEWDTGSIYVPPTRAWSFDDRFIDTPPPGSLTAVSIGRGALVRF
jgi:hypothetical protein